MTSNGDGSRAHHKARDGARLGDVLAAARGEFETLTSRRPESVSAARREGDGWRVTFEVVELERVPASTSVLGCYEVELDGDGAILGYERTGRYHRNRAAETDG